jgi:hypothetical protein
MICSGHAAGMRCEGATKVMEFYDRKEFRLWLKDTPRSCAIALASRAVLRIAPIIDVNFSKKDRDSAKKRETILVTFRCMALTWVVGSQLNKNANLGFAASTAISAALKARDDVAKAAIFAAEVFTSSANDRASAKAADAVDSALSAAAFSLATNFKAVRIGVTNLSKELRAAVNADANTLERSGLLPSALANQPLWPDRLPKWVDDNWRVMKAALLALEEDWDVWTDWYEARLRGDPGNEELELARVMTADEIWQQGPKVLNAHIKRLIEKSAVVEVNVSDTLTLGRSETSVLKATPPAVDGDDVAAFGQRPAAFKFAVQGAHIEATPQRETPIDQGVAFDIYAELKAKARELVERLQQTNSDQRATQTAQRLLDCLGGSLADVSPGILLMRHRSLEADAAAYDTPEARRELFPDAIAMIRDLIASADDLMSGYPSIRKIQAASLALEIQRSDVDAVQAKLAEIRAAAAQSQIVAPSARSALSAAVLEVDEVARAIHFSATDIVRAAAIERRAEIVSLQVLDNRNFISAVIQPLAGAGEGLRRMARESLKEAAAAVPRGVGAGVEETVKGLVKGGVATLVGSIIDPVTGLAVLIASLRPLARKTEEVKKALDAEPDAEKSSKSE